MEFNILPDFESFRKINEDSDNPSVQKEERNDTKIDANTISTDVSDMISLLKQRYSDQQDLRKEYIELPKNKVLKRDEIRKRIISLTREIRQTELELHRRLEQEDTDYTEEL